MTEFKSRSSDKIKVTVASCDRSWLYFLVSNFDFDIGGSFGQNNFEAIVFSKYFLKCVF